MPSRTLPLGVLASGRGSNLQAILDAIAQGRLSATVVLVAGDRDDAKAVERARAAGIPCVVVSPKHFPTRDAYDAEIARRLRKAGAEVVVLAGYMRIVTNRLLHAFPQRVINIHPSLLPAFPGLHAQRQALAHGVKVSGCTAHFVDEAVDSGAIILQASVPVLEDDTETSLAERILAEEHRILPQALQLYADGRLSIQGRRVLIAPAAHALT
jgi:phosphoribosylglycinamide formyltransferase-1